MIDASAGLTQPGSASSARFLHTTPGTRQRGRIWEQAGLQFAILLCIATSDREFEDGAAQLSLTGAPLSPAVPIEPAAGNAPPPRQALLFPGASACNNAVEDGPDGRQSACLPSRRAQMNLSPTGATPDK